MANPMLVTGAAGSVGAVGRTITGLLFGRDGQCGGGGEASRREGVHQYVADDALTDEHY